MPLAIRNLSVLAYANGFTLWHYKAGGTLEVVTAPQFFSDASDMLTAGDLVMVSASDGARILAVGEAVIGSVTVAPLA